MQFPKNKSYKISKSVQSRDKDVEYLNVNNYIFAILALLRDYFGLQQGKRSY